MQHQYNMAREPRIKKQTVTLVAPDGTRQELELAHAERLLDMGQALNGGWVLAEDSKYIYDEQYGIRVKSDKGNSTKA